MKKNLTNKIVLIIGVLLICLYGFFGNPIGTRVSRCSAPYRTRFILASIFTAARTWFCKFWSRRR